MSSHDSQVNLERRRRLLRRKSKGAVKSVVRAAENVLLKGASRTARAARKLTQRNQVQPQPATGRRRIKLDDE
jgi:hypothetical protein